MVSTYDDSYRPLHAPASITYNWSERYYTDDANGNLTNIPDFSDPYYISFPRTASNSITYNADNMPIRIENRKDDGAIVYTIAVDFTYDGNGTRAKKTLSTGSTTYYIGNHFEVANGVEIKYIFAGNQRIAKVTTDDSYFYHKDHLGSSSVMTDYPDGLTVETTEYLPFGHERDHTGTNVTDYKFTDQEKDTETGLYNYDARMYDPVIGLFISADSVDQDWYDPQSLNRYAYCRNNPLKYKDPSGHVFVVDDVAIAYAAATVATALALGIYHYGKDVAADTGKWLGKKIFNKAEKVETKSKTQEKKDAKREKKQEQSRPKIKTEKKSKKEYDDKVGDQQYQELKEGQRQASKNRPKINDSNSEWHGEKKRQKQSNIQGDKKSKDKIGY